MKSWQWQRLLHDVKQIERKIWREKNKRNLDRNYIANMERQLKAKRARLDKG